MQLKEFLKKYNLNSITCPDLTDEKINETDNYKYVGYSFTAHRTIKNGKIVFSHYSFSKCYGNILTHSFRKWCIDEAMGEGDIAFIVKADTMEVVF